MQLPTDPDEGQCTQGMWQEFVCSVPLSYANSLAVISWREEVPSTVDEVVCQLWEYEDSIFSSLISAADKLI